MGKNTAIERRKQTLSSEGPKTFMMRNFPLYIFMMFLIYPLAAFFSGLTEGFYVFSNFEKTLNSPSLAIFLTAIIVILIEGGSIVLGKSVFEDIRAGALGGSKNEIFVFVLKTIGFLTCYTFSVILSIGGAPETTTRIKEQRSPVALISIDSIHLKYDAMLAAEDADIAAGKKMTYRSVVISDGRKIIQAAKERKENIDTDRRTDIQKAEAENLKREEKYNSDTVKTGRWTMKFTGIGQLLMLLCLFFSFGYRNAEDEELNSNPPQSNTNNQSASNFFMTGSAPIATSNHITTSQPLPRRRIGFKQNGLSDFVETNEDDTNCVPCATNDTGQKEQAVPTEKIKYVAQDIGKYKKYIRTIYPRTLEPIPGNEPEKTQKIKTIESRKEKLRESIIKLEELGIKTSLNRTTGKAIFF